MCVCQWEDDKVVSMCGAHMEAARREYGWMATRMKALEESLRWIMKMIESNELVRNTAMDHLPDWWQRMVVFVGELKKAQELVAVLLLCFVVFLGGCSPLRGYKFASHGPGDTSAGDVTHASEPGARVVVPKKSKTEIDRPHYILSFDKPHADCVEVEHKLNTEIRQWACATQ